MEKVFLKTIHEHQDLIYKICRMYRDTKEDQQDLFQEIVFQLWKAFPHFRGEAKITTWMYRIALNTAILEFRKSKPPISYSDQLPDQLSVSGRAEELDQEEQMYQLLKCLDISERAILTLYLEEYSYKEIADITGISENYVGVKINRIKEKLKSLSNK
ncbi:sigma-70 family RNA polymerase sigma factor [Cytophagaceae bacterium DM2B3-1]|uniref:Sigma-70 family RNA polymerase sigma factor n=1 Tax=Xanthocytophaga flava TaxID=3048013 RepID=A0ABT7CQ05_9BACT|nr:sigma-70 family RNA polymerase sigma factor [Xanthocytophaga flavus]MDJ1495805.1 sigma-70 family RNA polymerase sigma factor [Xanthocytophaga flavus]